MTEKLTDHEYDDIREYDNPMPVWWKNIFWVTILFSAIYYPYYHFQQGKSVADEYLAEIQRFEAEHPRTTPGESEESLAALLPDVQVVAAGAAKFATVCAACHGQKGEGLIGPNLTDEFYLHGNSLTAMMATVRTGVPEKGMPAWDKLLTPDEQRNVVVFIGTLRGLKLPGKGPQGEPRS